ncbi:hypothetical protein ACHQM5_022587 [Ranunculus cassubicifolius]
MNHLHKLKSLFLHKKFPPNFISNHLISPPNPLSICLLSLQFAKNSIFYSNKAEKISKNDEVLKEKTIPKTKVLEEKVKSKGNHISRSRYNREAQFALQEYLLLTRDLPYLEAEYISKNCPSFINKLLKKVGEEEIVSSLAKLFRYHPINEFEPFYESVGLVPAEIDLILPQDKMFLKDDSLLLENYLSLCNYGIPRSRIGDFFRSALEIFGYEHGVLCSKLRAYEELGLTKSVVVKVVVSSPYLLIGNVNDDFVQIVDWLKSLEIEFKCVEGSMNGKDSYDWSKMLEFLRFIVGMGYSTEELQAIIKNHPSLLLDGSGRYGFHLIGLLVKFGLSGSEIFSLLLQFPEVCVGTFITNLRRCLLFLLEIEMDAPDIGKIVRAHTHMLGSCALKKTNSILTSMNAGRSRLCKIIKEDPSCLKKMVLGLKLEPLPRSREDEISLKERTEFLLSIGYTENSDELKKALKLFRGKGGELQERFEGLLEAGINRKDAIAMVKETPQTLNQTKDVVKQKIDYLVNVLGYPISALVTYPGYTNYTTERVKLRFAMYNWLKDRGKASPTLALSTILAGTEKYFVSTYVIRHPSGLDVWENLKKEHCK